MTDNTSDKRFISYNELLENFGKSTVGDDTRINSVKTPRVSTKTVYCSGESYLYGDVKTTLNAVNGLKIGDGDIDNPSISFAADPTVGYYRSQTGALSLVSNNNNILTINPNNVFIDRPITTTTGDLQFNPVGSIDFSGRPVINVGGLTVSVGGPNDVIINNNVGVLSAEAHLNVSRGGTGIDTSADTGIAHVTNGSWTISLINNDDLSDVTSLELDDITTSNIYSTGDLMITPSSNNILLGSSNIYRVPATIPGGSHITYITNIETLDDTSTAICTIPTMSGINGTSYNIHCSITLGDTTGGMNTALYTFVTKGKNLLGVVTVSNLIILSKISDGELSGTSVAADVSDTNIVINVIGILSHIKWAAKVDVLAQEF